MVLIFALLIAKISKNIVHGLPRLPRKQKKGGGGGGVRDR